MKLELIIITKMSHLDSRFEREAEENSEMAHLFFKKFNLTKEEKTSRENVIWHRSHRCRVMKIRKAYLDCMQWNRFLIKYTMEIL